MLQSHQKKNGFDAIFQGDDECVEGNIGTFTSVNLESGGVKSFFNISTTCMASRILRSCSVNRGRLQGVGLKLKKMKDSVDFRSKTKLR